MEYIYSEGAIKPVKTVRRSDSIVCLFRNRIRDDFAVQLTPIGGGCVRVGRPL
jgi:hypothetical protein